MFSYLNKIKSMFAHKQFRSSPIISIYRLFILFFLDLFKITTKVSINHYKFQFKFLYIPSNKIKVGGRGFFLLREKIEDLLEFGHKFINKNDHCIDGGANQGIFSLSFASAVGPNGKVVAVEPFDYCIKNLKQNIRLNNMHNIYLCQRVLYSKPDLDKKLDYSNGVGGASIVREFGHFDYITVKTDTVDEIVEKYDLALNFLKLDIEGAELEALKGSIKTLEKNKPILCLEGDQNNHLEICNFLKKFNYKPYFFEKNKLQKLREYKSLSNIFFLT